MKIYEENDKLHIELDRDDAFKLHDGIDGLLDAVEYHHIWAIDDDLEIFMIDIACKCRDFYQEQDRKKDRK